MFTADDRVKIIPYRGKKLLELDFSGCTFDQTSNIIGFAKSIIAKQPPKSLLTYSNFNGVSLEPKLVLAVANFVKENAPFVKAGAVIGLTGAKKTVLNTINRVANRKIWAFDDPVAAKDWLVQQDVPQDSK